MELIDSEYEEISLDGPVYTVDNIDVYEYAVVYTETYQYEHIKYPGEDCTFNINTNLQEVIAGESGVKSIAEDMGEITHDNQTAFINLISNIDESVEISENDDGHLIHIKYIKKLRYVINELSEELEFSDIVSVNDYVHFNDSAIFVNDTARYYFEINLVQNEYSYLLEDGVDYTVLENHDLSNVTSYISEIKTTAINEGELLIDKESYLLNLINSYAENINIRTDDGAMIIDEDYVISLNCRKYTGPFNSEDNIIESTSMDTNHVFNRLYYIDTITTDAVFVKGYDLYKLYAVDEENSYALSYYNTGDEFTLHSNNKADILQNITTAINTIKSDILNEGETFDVDRSQEFIAMISDYLDNVGYIRDTIDYEHSTLDMRKISAIRCERISLDVSPVNYINVLSPLDYYEIRQNNAENIPLTLIHSLNVDDVIHMPYTGILITKKRPTVNESYYPYYYNLNGTSGYDADTHYYTVENNFFIENFIFTEVQLQTICADMIKILQHVDFYNLSATYHALPYTEICDKLCLVGVNFTPDKQDDLYYTLMLRRNIKGNIGMTDTIETEFEND
jgi:hypothetical protein